MDGWIVIRIYHKWKKSLCRRFVLSGRKSFARHTKYPTKNAYANRHLWYFFPLVTKFRAKGEVGTIYEI